MPQTTLASAFLPPAVLGAALYALLAGPPVVHEQLHAALAKLPFTLSAKAVETGVKVLLGLYVVRAVSTVLDRWAFRNWEIFYSGAPWKWNEEIAVVTGGSGDIATAINKKFIARGMKVAILDVNPPKDPEMLNSKNVVFYKCDLTDSASIKETAAKIRKEIGIPTVLVNNAGIAIGMPILQIADKQLDRIFKVNLISHWYTVREFLPDMIKKRKGHIVSVASMASYTGVAGIADYSATKAGALAFHESLTQEIRHLYKAPFIRTTVAHPFWTKTAMTTLIEDGIKKTDVLVTPKYVGGVIADQVFSTIGGHLVIPDYNPKMRLAPMLRGWPTWLNSHALDGTKDNILTTMNTTEGLAEAKARYM